MQYKDISQDSASLYRLGTDEKCVFFMFNRSGPITFELAGSRAEAHIFSFFIGKDTDKASLTILQKHLAPQTISHTLIKSVLSDGAECAYEGLIFIGKKAIQSNASQESRAILLSPLALISLKPTLEILADDVQCHHAAAVSSLDPEALFFAKTRGLSEKQAKNLLIRGFFNEAVEKIQALEMNTDKIRKKLDAALIMTLK
jgi:Fe-S cluster assembly protein SufD